MYTFLFVNPDGATPVFEVAECEGPDIARLEALAMLVHRPERRAVEVWDETDRLFIVEREVR
jgi:hypothetical protein